MKNVMKIEVLSIIQRISSDVKHGWILLMSLDRRVHCDATKNSYLSLFHHTQLSCFLTFTAGIVWFFMELPVTAEISRLCQACNDLYC